MASVPGVVPDTLQMISGFRVPGLGQFGHGKNNNVSGLQVNGPLGRPEPCGQFLFAKRLGNENHQTP